MWMWMWMSDVRSWFLRCVLQKGPCGGPLRPEASFIRRTPCKCRAWWVYFLNYDYFNILTLQFAQDTAFVNNQTCSACGMLCAKRDPRKWTTRAESMAVYSFYSKIVKHHGWFNFIDITIVTNEMCCKRRLFRQVWIIMAVQGGLQWNQVALPPYKRECDHTHLSLHDDCCW